MLASTTQSYSPLTLRLLMKLSFYVLVVLSLVFSTYNLCAQGKWALESAFVRTSLPSFRLLNDFIPLQSNDISVFHAFLRFSEPSFQAELNGSRYAYEVYPYNLMQTEFSIGSRWMKFDSYQNSFLGASQFEFWLAHRPSNSHRISISVPVDYTRSIGDTIENYLYSAKLYRQQSGIGASYSKEFYSRKRWQIYSGIIIGYQIEYGRGHLQEFISDAIVSTYSLDSTRFWYDGFNNRSQTLSIPLAPTHVIISGFQLGVDFKLNKRIQLFELLQTQLLAIKNTDSGGRFARGFSLHRSIGIRYTLKPEKTRVYG